MITEKDSRRGFLLKLGAVAASVTIVPAMAAGCGGDKAGSGEAGTAAAGGEEGMATADCSDLSGLADADKNLRQTLQYVEVTPDPAKHCMNCQFFTAGASEGACGACTILKGPIAPGGYCTSWAAKPA
jgi:hypothetical protein